MLCHHDKAQLEADYEAIHAMDDLFVVQEQEEEEEEEGVRKRFARVLVV